MSDVHIFIMIIGGIFAIMLGSAWVLRDDPRFNASEDA